MKVLPAERKSVKLEKVKPEMRRRRRAKHRKLLRDGKGVVRFLLSFIAPKIQKKKGVASNY